ncbi:MAG: PocR ligand-binding domain-containing protein [Candidatus Ozemobacteraceae bacterium]
MPQNDVRNTENEAEPLDLENIELSDVIDAPALQEMLDDYQALTGIGVGIIDLKGNVLVRTGWQDICVKFHRVAPESCKFCYESDVFLSNGVLPGTFKAYRCKNNMWDIASPIMLRDKHIGNIFLGQFLYDDEVPDYDLFKAQAKKFGFDETAYIAALDRVPRFSKMTVSRTMSFYSKLAQMISKSNYNNVILADTLARQKKSEEALSNEHERLAVTLRSIGDGVITTDIQGSIVIMNRVAENLTGWPLSKAKNRPLSEVFRIVNSETRNPCENPVDKVLSSGKMIELADHTLLISQDGTERIIADSGAPIMDRDSKIIGVVLVFRDTTEKQKLLDTFQRNRKLDSLGVLAGGIAHDFNNMLAGIFGYLDLIRARSTDKTVLTYLEKTLQVFDRAKSLTLQLLTFSRGGAPTCRTGKLYPIIRESAAFALSGSNIACEYAIAENLWLVDFDKNQIAQVIDNLVINAKEAMPNGGKIIISALNVMLKKGEIPGLRGNKAVKISLTDSGIGIPQHVIKKVFDPFFSTKNKGSGLGLATCHAIVKNHGGWIDLESEPGKGTTLYVYLPASGKEITEEVFPVAMSHQGSGVMLIMDDEAFIRETLGLWLKDMGYSILEAKDGEEALARATETRNNNLSLAGIFLDLTIPGGMGGKETALLLRQNHPLLPVFASSGYSEDPIMAKPAEFGFTDSIRKPYLREELATLLNRYLPKIPPENK